MAFLLTIAIVAICVPGVNAARLPAVEGDEGIWGEILNEYLLVAHDENGYLRANSISTTELQIGTITGAYLSNGTINATHIQAGSITGNEIMDSSITADDIEPQTVDGDILSDYAIDRPSLIANDIINGDHIAAQSITNKHIVADSINSDRITDYTLIGDDISPDAELNIVSVEANYFYTALSATSTSCDTSPEPCTARISCPESTTVLFGMASSISVGCDANPSECNQYCIPQADSCEVYSEGGAASVYIVCSRVV